MPLGRVFPFIKDCINVAWSKRCWSTARKSAKSTNNFVQWVRFIDSSLCGSKATEEGERIMTEDRFRVSVNSQCHARRPCGGRYVVNS